VKDGTTERTEDTEMEDKQVQTNDWQESTGEARPKVIHEQLIGKIRQTAFEVHQYFGHGFLEKVYENSLAHLLRNQGLKATHLRIGMLLNFGRPVLQLKRFIL
jgi:hypothetical protein